MQFNQQVQTNPATIHRFASLAVASSLGNGMLAVMDASIARDRDLAAGLLPGANLLVLDSTRDGIAQISDYLQQHSGYTSLHIISHGAPGRLHLGNGSLALDNLNDYATRLQAWKVAFEGGSGFEVMLYGCETAKGETGRTFVQQLAALTEARVAASSTLTGCAALGGDWVLDFATSPELRSRPLAFTQQAQQTYGGVFISTFAQLRDAINSANSGNPNPITIDPGVTITVGSAFVTDSLFGPIGLPIITGSVVIQGSSGSTIQGTGSAANPFRLFAVAQGGSLTLDGDGGAVSAGDGDRNNPGLILQGGYAQITDPAQPLGDDGGAIANAGGSVNIDNVRFQNNTAADDGGAILNLALNNPGGSAALIVYDSAFVNNRAIGDGPPSPDGGGAIENDSNLDEAAGVSATVSIENVLFQGNSSGGTGGALRNRDGGETSVLQSDFVGNTATGGSSDISQTNASGTTTTLEIDQDSLDAVDDTSINGPGDTDIEVVDADVPILSVFQVVGAAGGTDDIPISDGQMGVIDLGSVIEGTPVTATTFLIRNDGSADLILTSNPSATASFDATTFAAIPTTVAPGAFVEFDVDFSSATVGDLTGSVEFGTGTTGDGTFNFDVEATVDPSAPRIQVELLEGGVSLGEIADNRTIPISLGNVTQNDALTATTFRITNTGDEDLALGNVSFTGAAGSSFQLTSPQPTMPLTPGATTTFDIAYNTAAAVGTLDGTVEFTTDADNADGTFNFAVQGTINAGEPTLVVTKINGIPQAATDGSTTPILLGDTNSGTPRSVVFEVANAGNSDLTLAPPTLASTDGFSLNTGGFNPTLVPDATTSFTVTFDGTTPATLNSTVRIAEADEDPAVSSDGIFDFAIRATVDGGVSTSEPIAASDTLSFDTSDRVFVIGDTAQSGSNLELKLNNISSSKILDVRASKVDGSNQAIETANPLAILPDSARPNGFNASSQASIFSFSSLQAGDRLVVEVETIDGETITFDSNQIQVADIGGGQFSLSFSNSAFGSLELILRQTSVGDALGSTTNQQQGLEILDLSAVSGSPSAGFTVYREADFSNFVGFYQIDDLSGTVGGIAPGQSGYAEAAVNARVSGIELSVSNQSISTANASLGAGAFYAPFILVQAGVNQFLEENPDNFAGAGPQAYFVFQGANPDGADHIRLLGDNVFGFEDLPGGGDRDFNDIIVKVDISVT